MRMVLWLLGSLICTVSVFAETDQVALVEAFAPEYPLVAVYSASAGEVQVTVTIDKAGAVTRAKAVQGHRLLAAAAEEAAKKWRFTAGGGVTEVTIGFLFRILPKGTPESELTTRFRAPFQMEVRRIIPEATTNSDPATDPPRRKAK
jgi:TonB family protein